MGSDIKSWLKCIPYAREAVGAFRRRRWLIERNAAFADYSRRTGVLKLQIGSGINVLDGWFNVDVFPVYPNQYYVDATNALPFGDSTFDYVFSEHMIEHISYPLGRALLQECYRITKPGGRIRIATPDLRKIAALYSEVRSSKQKEYIDAVIARWRTDYGSNEVGIVINNIFGFEHAFIYDRGTLEELMKKAGFESVVQCAPGESERPSLAGLEAHIEDYIAFETLVLEAGKPESDGTR